LLAVKLALTAVAVSAKVVIDAGYGGAFKKQSATFGPKLLLKALITISSNSRYSPTAIAAPLPNHILSLLVRPLNAYFAFLFNLYILFIFYLEIY